MLFSKRFIKQVYAPVCGSFIPLEDVKDTTFNSGLMGPGLGIYPDDTCVVSPVDGEVIMVFPTRHAIGLRGRNGLEILIHIGIETVNLRGKGFQTVCKKNQTVKAGEPLVRFDKEFIKKEKLDPTVIVIFTNAEDYEIQLTDGKKHFTHEDVIANVEKK